MAKPSVTYSVHWDTRMEEEEEWLASQMQFAHLLDEIPEPSLEEEEVEHKRSLALGVFDEEHNVRTPGAVGQKDRAPTAPAIGAIVRAACEKYDISITNLLDIGSGPHGRMVGELLPEQARDSAVQMDINTEAVRTNRALHPSAAGKILAGSYFRLQELFHGKTFSTVTGLSCLDCTFHVRKALESIVRSLEIGGTFLHVQDVGPSDSVIAAYAQRKLSPLFIAPLTGKFMQNAPAMLRDPVTEKFRYMTDFFREILQAALEATPQLEILTNNYVVAEAEGFDQQNDNMYLHGIDLMNPGNNESEPKYRAMALVTVARRKT